MASDGDCFPLVERSEVMEPLILAAVFDGRVSVPMKPSCQLPHSGVQPDGSRTDGVNPYFETVFGGHTPDYLEVDRITQLVSNARTLAPNSLNSSGGS